MSIKTKLLWLFLLISSFPALVIGYLNFIHIKETLETLTIDSLKVMAEFKEGEVFLYLEEMKTRAEDFASDGFIRDSLQEMTNGHGSGPVVEMLNRHLRENKQILDQRILAIDILDLDGNIISSTIDENIGGLEVADNEFRFDRGRVHFSDVFHRTDSGTAIRVMAPLSARIDTQRPIGVLSILYDASRLNDLMTGAWVLGMGAKTQVRGKGETGESYLVDTKGRMITDSLFVSDAPFNVKVDTLPVQRCREQSKEIVGAWKGYRGVEVVGASMCISLGDFKWTLVVEQDEWEAFEPVEKEGFFLVMVMAVTWFFVLLIALFITKNISRPIQTLRDSTISIAKGNLDHTVIIDTRDEIGDFSRAFADMLVQLRESKLELEYANRSLYNTIDQLNEYRTDLEQANQSLQKKNQELDDFTYIASHDLQEPLRKIISFGDLLRLDLGEDLPPEAEKDLSYMTDAAKRMQMLILDLLALSRAGRNEMNIEWVPLERVVDQALSNLEIRIQETGTVIKRDPLPEVMGDEVLLTQLYQNLLSNAMKFCKRSNPEIHVTAEVVGGVQVMGVKDNGIGIDPKYGQQIFHPFKRLHGQTEYKGSGIGLAICAKAIERHMGTLWVESEPGEGAHFKYLLNTEHLLQEA